MRSGISGRAALAVTACVALTAASCGSGESTLDPSDVSGSVTFWDTSGQSEAPFFSKLVASFEREHPRIDVKYVQVDFFEAQERYAKAQREGRGVPDVLRADVGWTAGFIQQGYLVDLSDSPALNFPALDEEFLETTTASVTQDDGVYGVPQVVDPLALLYNKRLLEEAGISSPPATWKELKAAALRINERTEADGIALNTDGYFSLPFLLSEESDLVDPERSTITVANAGSVRAAKTAAELVSSGAALKPPLKDAYGAMQSAFRSGQVAMIVNGPWATADLFGGSAFRKRDNLGIAPLPAGSTGVAASPTGGHNLVVSNMPEDQQPDQSHDTLAAELFVGFMTAAEQQEQAALELGLLPTRKAAYTSDVLSDPVRNSFYFAHTKAVPRVPLPQSGELFAAYEPHWTAILRGEKSASAGLRATAEEWRSELLPGYHIER